MIDFNKFLILKSSSFQLSQMLKKLNEESQAHRIISTLYNARHGMHTHTHVRKEKNPQWRKKRAYLELARMGFSDASENHNRNGKCQPHRHRFKKRILSSRTTDKCRFFFPKLSLSVNFGQTIFLQN